jgi:molecular chaperone DnaK
VTVGFELSRARLEAMIDGYVDRTIQVCRQVIHAARVPASALGQVIMVGGSTRIPLVRRRVAELFGREVLDRINPDEVVAQGAALQASILSGQLPAAPAGAAMADADMDPGPLRALPPASVPDDAILLDVNPASLGVATAGGFTDRILEKNAPIPIERTKSFTTARDGQTRVVITCVRGEARKRAEGEVLGELILEDIPAAPRGEVELAVTFRVDTDGILHVRAVDARTGQARQARLNVIGAPVTETAGAGDRPEPAPR